jgi:nitronate monooxygenase
VDWVITDEPALLEAAIAAKPALLSDSFGDNWSWVQRAHDAGLAAATQSVTSKARSARPRLEWTS